MIHARFHSELHLVGGVFDPGLVEACRSSAGRLKGRFDGERQKEGGVTVYRSQTTASYAPLPAGCSRRSFSAGISGLPRLGGAWPGDLVGKSLGSDPGAILTGL